MRARDRDRPDGAGAQFGLRHGVVGIGDVLPRAPRSLEEAVRAAAETHGAKAGRMVDRFAALPVGTAVWTRGADGTYWLGRIAGAWRYDDSPAARRAGIHHVRPAVWLDRPFGEVELPGAVPATFARGGRNLQRIRSDEARELTDRLWAADADAMDRFAAATATGREGDA